MGKLKGFAAIHVFVFALTCATTLWGQSETAVLFGVVKDSSGAPIMQAKVTAKNQSTGAQRELPSNESGLFYFTQLSPGNYELTVETAGFKVYRDTRIHLQVAQVGRLDVTLEIGNTSESIVVDSEVSPLNTQTVAQGTVITSEKLPSLPLNGRQFLQLVLLAPGANPGGRAVQQNSLRQGQVGGLSIAGGRTNNTSFLLDGAVNIDPDFSSLNYSPSIDNIAEFQVQTAMVPAEYGRAAVNVVTKSGSNVLHGSGWEFLRNKALDSRPFNLNGALPQFQRNQAGATVGGPIVKNKLFAFGTYEALRVHQAGAGLTTVTVPGELKRTGNFSETKGGIWDPLTLSNGLRQAFPGNIIPANRISPLVMAAVQALPLATDPRTSGYVNSNGLLVQNNNNYSGRADFVATSKWTLFGRYSTSRDNASIPQTIPGRDGLNDGASHHAAVGSTYVLSSNLINETRLGFSRLNFLSGLPELTFNTANGGAAQLPQFNITGYPLIGGAGGYNTTNSGSGIALSRNNTYQIYDTVSWNRGKHAVKFGGEIMQVQFNRFEASGNLGNFQFTNGFTTRTAKNDGSGDALASAYLAMPAIATRAFGPSRIDARQNVFSTFVQDDWRILSNVTINIGLRYELAPPFWDTRQQMSSIDYTNVPGPAGIFAAKKTGYYMPTLFICGQSGTPKGCASTDYNNFAPRLGVVYSATPKLVIRAGAGMFYANTDANPLFRLAASLPSNVAQTLNSDNYIPRFEGFDVFGSTFVGQAQLQAAGIDKNQKTSYTVQGNVSMQYEMKKGIVIETGYIGTLGLKLEQNVQPNNAQPGLGAVDPRRPFAGVVYAAGTKFPDYLTVVGNSVPIGLINYLPHSAQSNYHSLYVRFEKRFSHGLSWLSSYTWSKAITNAPQFRNAGGANGSENSPAQDSFNLQAERALASFHVAHRAVNTFLYELPFGKKGVYFKQGLGSKLLGGWEISGIFSAQTGFPYTVNLKGDTAGVGAGTGGIFIRPNLVPGTTATLTSAARSTDRWFNIDAFSAPAAGAFGSVGRNTMTGPGLTNVDMVLARVIPVTERFQLQLRGEVFNVLNHSNYNIVGRILNDPTFGRVLSQLDPRQVQFGAKLVF